MWGKERTIWFHSGIPGTRFEWRQELRNFVAIFVHFLLLKFRFFLRKRLSRVPSAQKSGLPHARESQRQHSCDGAQVRFLQRRISGTVNGNALSSLFVSWEWIQEGGRRFTIWGLSTSSDTSRRGTRCMHMILGHKFYHSLLVRPPDINLVARKSKHGVV